MILGTEYAQTTSYLVYSTAPGTTSGPAQLEL